MIEREDYSGQPSAGAELLIRAEGPKQRPVVFLPRTVAVWMVYTKRGRMRANALREGNLADSVNGWTIQWHPGSVEYVCRKRGRATIRTTRKDEAYRVAETDGDHRPEHHG